MEKKVIYLILLVFTVTIVYILFLQPVIKAETLESLNGTDIYNGLRGQDFDEGWKFYKGDVNGGQNTNYNDSSWSNITLPHDWSIFNSFNQNSPAGSGAGYLDGGIGWYRKQFTLPADSNDKKVYINFDGVYMNSEVWINGNKLGTRPYGYVSFEYDLTPYLNFNGTNVIAVKVNNNQPTSRWYSGSGIYRNVWLTTVNPVHVDYCGMFVTTPSVSNSLASVNVKTKVLNQLNSSQSVSLKTTIIDANGNDVANNLSSQANISANRDNTFTQNLSVSNPHLWSTNSPYLYTAQTDVIIDGKVVDTYISSFGIRYFNFDSNNGFSLNGVKVKLNGVCLHHDLGSLGTAVNYRAIERKLEIMKDMGCNAIRTSHNPVDPQFLEICDRLGLMVMEEAFDCWETGKNNNDYHLYFNSWAQTDIKSMVTRDRNHPSIIIWSIGNEIFDATVSTATNLKNWVKEIDTTRPVTCGSNEYYYGLSTEILNVLDLVGYNYNPGIYDDRHKNHPDWKIFGSETSSAVRSRGIYKTPINQNILTGSDNQCSSYDNSVVSWGNSAESSYTEINKRNYMAGEFIWTGFDYIGEPTPYGWPAKSSYFGIVDTCGFAKDIYYFYQSKWTTKPMVHILPHWNWSNGTTVEVWAYSNCDTVELFLNGVSQGVKNVGNSLHLSWNVPWSSGTLQAKATKGGTVVYDQVATAGSAAKVQLKPDRATIKADGKDLVYIEADITDSNGVIVPTASNTVNFSISGPGTIVGVDNGNAISLESYKGSSRSAFSGKCLVIVQAAKTPGTIVVNASSGGLSSGSVSITTTGGTNITPTPSTSTPAITTTPTGISNIALNKTASCDSQQSENPASAGNDDNTLSRWCANDANTGHWWTVDLGQDYNINGTEVMWEFASAYQYKIEVSSDNVNWTLKTDKTSNTNSSQTQTDSFIANARYVKITVTGLATSNWASFYEFRVMGSLGTTTPGNTVGDVNNSGTVDITDALMVAQYAVGKTPEGFIVANADVNNDGTINIVDALRISQYYVGLITDF